MPIKLSEAKDGKVLEIQVSGKFNREDFDLLTPRFDALRSRHGTLDVLLEMVDFHGWATPALWDEIRFDAKHFADVDRLAMVGEQPWQRNLARLCSPFTMAEVRYFDRPEIAEARRWLGEERAQRTEAGRTQSGTG